MRRWIVLAALALAGCHKASNDVACAGKPCPYGQLCVMGPSPSGPAATCVTPCFFNFECPTAWKCSCASAWRCEANLTTVPPNACYDPNLSTR